MPRVLKKAKPKRDGVRIIYDLSFDEYRAIDAVNASYLCDLAKSARTARYRKKYPRESAAFDFGRALHVRILEPERFAETYYPWLGGRRSGNMWELFKEKNKDKIILTESDWGTIGDMSEAIKAHPIASALIKGGRSEVTLIWKDKRTKTKCKARIDYLRDRDFVDLKTTTTADVDGFPRKTAPYLYDLRMAFYADGVAACVEKALTAKIIAIEKEPPYEIAVFNIDEEHVLQHGRLKYEKLLDLHVMCKKTKSWPGIADDGEFEYWLPEYAKVKEDFDLTFDGVPL